MTQDPQTLLAAASCFSCYGSDRGLMELMKLALLQQILLAVNPNAVTDPQTLLAQANCYSCMGNSAQWQLMELALLAQIANNGSTVGGGGGVTSIIGGTNVTVSPPSGTGAVTINASGGSSTGGIVGTGAPNGAVVGNVGQNYTDSAAQTFWIKETGNATNTGWVQFI